MNFTTEQKNAIEDRSPYLLVSAAAGAGKTAVLVERIVSLIVKDGISIDRMLIMTFTNAAASELRQRLSKRLYEESIDDYTLSEQLSKLAFANIGTMHSFCLKLIKQEFALLGLNANVHIATNDYREKLYNQAIDDMFEEVYTDISPALESFSAAYKEDGILKIIAKVYSSMLAMPDPWGWLKKSADGGKGKENLEEKLYDLAYKNIQEIIEDINYSVDEYRSNPGIKKQFLIDYEKLQIYDLTVYPFDKENIDLYRVEFDRLKPYKEDGKELMISHRDTIKKKIKILLKSLDLLEEYSSGKEIILSHISAIEQMLISLHKHFQNRKKNKNVVDYSDMEQMALSLLNDEAVKDKINSSFDAIFVDECQDNSAIQDEIIHKLKTATNMIFMVGDIKQSIYRFRNAEPNLFLDKLNAYSIDANQEKRKILLNKNYRSNPYIIDATNRVFDTVMIPDPMELSYKKGLDWLQAGREDKTGTAVKFRNIFFDSNREADGRNITASFVARQIKQLIGTPLPNSDKLIEYEDIAILAPQVTVDGLGKIIIDTLDEYSIPFVCSKLNSLGGFTGIDQIIAWLSILTNSLDDLSLLAVLRGPVFNIDDETLAQIRLACPDQNAMFTEAFYYCAHHTETDTESEKSDYNSFVDWNSDIVDKRLFTFQQALENKDKISENDDKAIYQLCKDILKLINQERFIIRFLPFDKYIWSFIERSLLFDYYEGEVNGAEYIYEIESFCVKANTYIRDTGVSVAEFLEDYKTQRDNKSRGEDNRAIASQHGFVTVGTIHSSKGLEYPIVFLVGLENSIGSNRRNGSSVELHAEYGIGLKYKNPETRLESSSMIYEAISGQNDKELRAEKARLLYVAMTRAKEALYMVSSEKITVKAEEDEDISDIAISAIHNFLDSGNYNRISHALKNAGSYVDLIRLALNTDKDFCNSKNNVYMLPDTNNNFIDGKLEIQNFVESNDKNFYDWDIKLAFADSEKMKQEKELMPTKLKYLTPEAIDNINNILKDIVVEPLNIKKRDVNPDYTRIEQVGDRVLLKTTITHVCEVIVNAGEFNEKQLPISDNSISVPKEHTLLYEPKEDKKYEIKPDVEHKEIPPNVKRLGTIKHYILELLDLERIRKLFQAGGREYRIEEGYAHIAEEAQVIDKLHTPLLDDATISKFNMELNTQNIKSLQLQELYNMVLSIATDMRDSGNINKLEFNELNLYDICAFYINPIGIRMLNSNLVLREHSITLYFEKWDPQIVQGTIDICFLEDGKWVIVDYKSDKQGMSKDSKNYLQQLALYKLALDSSSPFKTKECFIYSISSRKEYRV